MIQFHTMIHSCFAFETENNIYNPLKQSDAEGKHWSQYKLTLDWKHSSVFVKVSFFQFQLFPILPPRLYFSFYARATHVIWSSNQSCVETLNLTLRLTWTLPELSFAFRAFCKLVTWLVWSLWPLGSFYFHSQTYFNCCMFHISSMDFAL